MNREPFVLDIIFNFFFFNSFIVGKAKLLSYEICLVKSFLQILVFGNSKLILIIYQIRKNKELSSVL